MTIRLWLVSDWKRVLEGGRGHLRKLGSGTEQICAVFKCLTTKGESLSGIAAGANL